MKTQAEILEGYRKQIFEGEDRSLYLHIGFFMTWYSACEARITMLLARATNSTDLESFDLLTRGMDAKTKVERLREACRGHGIGERLDVRLRYFYDRIIPLRNKIAHRHMGTDPSFSRVHFSSLSQLPFEAYGEPKLGKAPPSETFGVIFSRALWQKAFHDDLVQAWDNATQAGTFEIENPRSPLPRTNRQQPLPSTPPSTPSKRERKRLRKGQAPRTRRSAQ